MAILLTVMPVVAIPDNGIDMPYSKSWGVHSTIGLFEMDHEFR
jgi:hypothetical protein